MTDIGWATRGLAFLINNPNDADVILGEQLVHGWTRYRGIEGADRASYVAGFRNACAVLGVTVTPDPSNDPIDASPRR